MEDIDDVSFRTVEVEVLMGLQVDISSSIWIHGFECGKKISTGDKHLASIMFRGV